MGRMFKKLCPAELDRVTAAEICIDELLTTMDRHNCQDTLYHTLKIISSGLHAELTSVEDSQERRARIIKIRRALTDAMPLSDDDLECQP